MGKAQINIMTIFYILFRDIKNSNIFKNDINGIGSRRLKNLASYIKLEIFGMIILIWLTYPSLLILSQYYLSEGLKVQKNLVFLILQ